MIVVDTTIRMEADLKIVQIVQKGFVPFLNITRDGFTEAVNFVIVPGERDVFDPETDERTTRTQTVEEFKTSGETLEFTKNRAAARPSYEEKVWSEYLADFLGTWSKNSGGSVSYAETVDSVEADGTTVVVVA